MTAEFDEFVKSIFPRKTNSNCIAILGMKQSGKTDFMLYLMEKMWEHKLMDAFGSNMPMKAPFPVDYINNFQTLKDKLLMLNPDPNKKGLKKYFYFGSEMGKWLPKDQSWRNVEFIEEMQTIRKHGLSWGGDAIDRVDARVLNPIHFDGCFTKYNPKNPKVAYYDDWQTGERTYLEDIPRTKIEFDTFYSANFFMKPQTPEGAIVPLNYEHEIAFRYADGESWKKIGVPTQKGKRCVIQVLNYHRTHCVPHLTSENQESALIEAEIAKDSVEVTE